MPKVDLTSVIEMKGLGADRILAMKTSEFSWQAPTLWTYADMTTYRLYDLDNMAVTSDLVTGVTDTSGNGVDAVQATSGLRPNGVLNTLNGHAVATFDGIDDRLEFAATLAEGWSMFMVVKANSADTAAALLGDTDANTFIPLMQTGAAATNTQVIRIDGVNNGTEEDVTKNATEITIVSRGDAHSKICTNDWIMVCLENLGPFTGTMTMGGATGLYLNGQIALLIIKPHRFTDDERDRTFGRAAYDFGLQALLPVDHPYKSSPPTVTGEAMPTSLELANVARTWFNSPNMLRDGDLVLFTGVDDTGIGAQLHSWDLTDDTVTLEYTASTAAGDDHNEGAIFKSAAGTYVFASCAHHQANFEMSVGSSPATLTETALDASLGMDFYSYANLVQLTGETNSPIYLFGRTRVGTPWQQNMSTSIDEGATWSAYQTIITGSGSNRPYIQYCQVSPTRVDFLLTNGNPEEVVTHLYHGYMQAGEFFQSDGTSLGAAPILASTFTKIQDGTTARNWCWDFKLIDGFLVGVFASLQSDTKHRLHRCTWELGVSSSWTVETVVNNAGPYLYAAHPSYSGGICIDPNDKDILYASILTDGVFQIYRMTRDATGYWEAFQITDESEYCFRPDCCDGALTYLRGPYPSFTDFPAVDMMGIKLPI